MARFVWIGLLLFVSGCATVARGTGPGQETTLESLCGKYAVACVWDGVTQTITMERKGQRIQALVGSSIVMVGGTKLALSAPLKRRQGVVIVPPDFERLVFPPEGLASEGEKAFHGLVKVVVDAGHGGKDPGAIGFGGLKEKDVNLDIAARIARDLRDAGIDVVMTRDSDAFITLPDRTSVASRPGIDLFVSVHSNATKSRRVQGYDVYASAPLNSGDKSELQRVQNEKKLCAQLKMRQDLPELKDIVIDMCYAQKLKITPYLADAVTHGLSQELHQGEHSSKSARYFVLRNTLIPAILIEVGFITNPHEAMQLKDGSYRQKIADAVTKGLTRCMHAQGF